MLKKILLILAAVSVIGCTKPPKTVSVTTSNDAATIKLAEAANSVSRSLNELAWIQAAATPPRDDSHLVNPTLYGMQTRTSVDWSGPIGPLVSRIADAGEFKLRILGKEPAIPVLVMVSAKDARLGDILRDIDFQAGTQAELVVYPEHRVIELRYAEA